MGAGQVEILKHIAEHAPFQERSQLSFHVIAPTCKEKILWHDKGQQWATFVCEEPLKSGVK